MVPLPDTLVDVSVIVIVPEKDVPDWVTCHVIWPGPEESEADPVHVPVTLVVEGPGPVG
jgi:hypothetical protein